LSNVNYFNDASGYYTIGARYYSSSYSMFWKGCIDEVRISSGTWNASWMKTCYNNQNNPASFFSLSSQEQVSSGWVNRAPTFSNPSPVNGSTGVNRYHATNVTVSDLDGNSTLVCLWYGSNISGPWTKAQQNTSVVANTTVRDLNSSYSSGWSTQYWWRVTAYDGHVNSSMIYTFTTQQQNLPPNKPSTPSGQTNGKTRQDYSYTTSTTDPNGDQVYYLWDWGDGNNSGWLGPYNSGVSINTIHNWAVKGSYSIKVKAKDIHGNESVWSDPLPITMPYSYNPIQQFLNWLFQRFPHAFPILRHLMGYSRMSILNS